MSKKKSTPKKDAEPVKTEVSETDGKVSLDKTDTTITVQTEDTEVIIQESKPSEDTNSNALEKESKEPQVNEVEPLFTYKTADSTLIKVVNDYLNAVKASDVKTAAKSLARVFQILMDKPAPNNVSAILSFFRKYNASLLDDRVGLQGASHLSLAQRTKVEILYKVFKNIVEDRVKSMDMRVVTKAVGEALTTEIIKKMKR